MKKSNKGFSMVELIIVIAIMAILAGALAPALIKYINKSRLSTDIQTGQTIATAITTALSSESAYDCAPSGSAMPVASLSGAGTSFSDEFMSALGTSSAPKGKAKKTLSGSSLQSGTTGDDFLVDLEPVSNTVKVYRKGVSNYEVYPNVDSDMGN